MNTPSSSPTPNDQPDPVERYVPLVLRLAVYLILAWMLVEAADAFCEYHPGKYWPRFISMFRMFTFLPIHEAGHFFFRPFGRIMTILGGSVLQVLVPLLWFCLALWQRSQVAPFPLFWVGENLMDVSLYMRDAPVRMLPLLGGDTAGHDWFNLFRQWDLLDSADSIADVLYYGGFAIAIVGIAAGVVLAFIAFLRPAGVPPSAIPVASPEQIRLEDKLDSVIEERERKQTLE